MDNYRPMTPAGVDAYEKGCDEETVRKADAVDLAVQSEAFFQAHSDRSRQEIEQRVAAEHARDPQRFDRLARNGSPRDAWEVALAASLSQPAPEQGGPHAPSYREQAERVREARELRQARGDLAAARHLGGEAFRRMAFNPDNEVDPGR